MGLKKTSLMTEFEKLRPQLIAAGVEKIRAEYNGGGDEGFCESAEYVDGAGHELIVTDELDRAVRDLAFEFTADHAGGWWNNEGGYGHVVFDVLFSRVKVEHNDYIQETEYSEAEYGND